MAVTRTQANVHVTLHTKIAADDRTALQKAYPP